VTDVTSGLFVLAGAVVGGIGSSYMTLMMERGKFQREHDASEAAEKRAFHIEALKRSQETLHALYEVAQEGSTQRRLTDDTRAKLNHRRLDAIMWSDRLRDGEAHAACSRAIISCARFAHSGADDATRHPTPDESAARAIDEVATAQKALSESLKALFE
jgi:hypothetical protein